MSRLVGCRAGLLIVSFGLCWLPTAAGAAIVNVGPGGSIQDAISAAGPGDEVVVAPGYYHQRIVVDRPITVRGTDPDDPTVVAGTVLDGDAAGSVVTTSAAAANCQLKGLTITNGRAVYGGGVAASATVAITNCHITANLAASGGERSQGGGVYGRGRVELRGSLVAANTSTGCGGGLQAGSVVCEQTTFRGNVAHVSGGAIYGRGAKWNPWWLLGCRFLENHARVEGGAVYLTSLGYGSKVDGVVFRGNSAPRGGALRAPSVELSHCLFSGNTGQQGAALLLLPRDTGEHSDLRQTTIVGNKAGAGAGVVRVENPPDSAAEFTLYNSIVAGNSGGAVRVGDSTAAHIRWCDFYANTGGNLLGGDEHFEVWSLLKADPLFADPSRNDFHLKSQGGRYLPGPGSWVRDAVTSPCIDAGDKAAAFSAEPGCNGARANLGAYGNTAEASHSHAVAPVRWRNVADGATDVPPNEEIGLVFSEPMNRNSVGEHLTLRAVGAAPEGKAGRWLSLTWGWGNDQVVYVREAPQLAFSTTYELRLTAEAETKAGRPLGRPFVMSFTTCPRLLADTAPGDGATDVNPQPEITIRFSRRLRLNEEGTHFRSMVDTGDYAYNDLEEVDWPTPNREVRCRLTSPVSPGESCTITITGARFEDGRDMTWSESFSFTVGDHVVVLAHRPRWNWVLPETPVRLKFDRAMVTGSVEKAFSISPAVAGTFQWQEGRRTVLFVPKAPLAADTWYTVTVGPGARGSDGQSLRSPYSWEFKTRWLPPAPTVQARAAPAAGGVALDVTLTAAASVQVAVCNLAGHRVALLPGRDLKAGTTALLWNGRGSGGTAAPAGTYLLRVTARSAAGAQATALTTCTLRR